MPPVPEVADIVGEKRTVEVLRGMDAEEITDRDGKCAVAGEIKEQVKAIGIHIGDDLRPGLPARVVEPINLDQRSQDELIQEPAE